MARAAQSKAEQEAQTARSRVAEVSELLKAEKQRTLARQGQAVQDLAPGEKEKLSNGGLGVKTSRQPFILVLIDG